MPTFEEYANAGRVVILDSEMVPKCAVVRPEDFQYAKQCMIFGDVAFSCWFTVDGAEVEDSDACIHMAEPSTGRFVFYEIKGVLIDLKQVNGCRLQLRERGKVVGDAKFSFLGLKGIPQRCVTMEDFATSRVLVEFKTRNDTITPQEAPVEGKRSRSVLDIIAGKAAK